MDRQFPAYQGDEPYVFVSYAHEDSDVVFLEIQWLNDQGFHVWFDEGISPGSRWSDELATSLQESALFLYFGTPNSVVSKHCQDEISLALDSDKPTIAVYLQETELTPGLKLRLSSHQAILKHKLSEQEYFSEGISDDILNALVKNTEMKVIARTSSFQFKGKNQDIREIGDILDVTHILEGSVRKVGNQIRVTAQLNKTADGSHVWSDQYDRELTDVFKVQDDITQHIVRALNAEFLGSGDSASGTSNVEAYNAILLGRFYYERFEPKQAISFFEQAIDLDQNYANAYGMLAFAHLQLMNSGQASPSEKIPLFRELMEKCLSLDPDNPAGHSGMAYLSANADHDFQAAINEYVKLISDNPRSAGSLLGYGGLLGNLKQYDLAFRIFDRALTLDPLNLILHTYKAYHLITAGRYDEARDALVMVERLGGKTAFYLAELARLDGDVEGIETQLDRAQNHWLSEDVYAYYESEALFLRGDREQAKVKFETRKQNTGFQPSQSAIRFALLEGDVELALTLFERAVDDSDPQIYLIVVMPAYAQLRAHPKYQDIVRKIGWDDDSLAKLKIPPLPF